MEKPTRSFTTARHAQRRDLAKACRATVKGSKWRSSSGTLFGTRDGWFLAMQEMTGIVQATTKARMTIKPMAVDPLFWDMIGEPQLCGQSLSFRYFGALVCPGLILPEVDIDEDGGVPAIAARMLDIAERTLDDVARNWTLDTFLERIAASINPKRLFPTAIATMIAAGRDQEALDLCLDAAGRGEARGFVSRRGTFPQLAARYIEAKLSAG